MPTPHKRLDESALSRAQSERERLGISAQVPVILFDDGDDMELLEPNAGEGGADAELMD